MQIICSPRSGLPRKLQEADRQLPPPAAGPRVARLPGDAHSPTSLYRVAVPAMPVPSLGLSDEKIESLLRLVSEKVAEQFGNVGRFTNAVIWLSVDAKRLHDNWHELEKDGAQRVIEVGRLAATGLGAVGLIPGLQAAASVETPLYFLADVGESIHQGRITFSAADLADYAGAPGADALKLNELLR
jgi:hypothetical protein